MGRRRSLVRRRTHPQKRPLFAEGFVDVSEFENGCRHRLASLLLRRIGERHDTEGVVHQHCQKQHDADDEARPVAVKGGEINALIDDGEGDGEKAFQPKDDPDDDDDGE